MTSKVEVLEFSDLASIGNNSQPAKAQWAVKGRNIYYEYGTPMRQVVALRNVSLNIPQGVIYGLLGPSGCGKTTLLRCLLGRLTPSSGSIQIFGSRPGSTGSLVPGPGIGYMPQELALWMQFSARETINYFGQLYGLSKEDRRLRVDFLLKFLDLKDADRRVEDLSGGQRRRVSLGAALVHRPPLVILDEPTVGVDPLLRESIWKHLVDLTKNDGITAIITTHYIEEARQADLVGLMREGNILVEDNPDQLMVKHQKDTLEAIFLKICHDQKSGVENNSRNRVSIPSIASPPPSTDTSPIRKLPASLQSKISVPRTREEKMRDSMNKIYALTCKTAVRLLRNIPILLFQLVLPTIQIVLFCLCIGQEPKNLEVAVYNKDYSGANYSHQFLNGLSSDHLKLVYKDSREAAIDSVRDGKAYGAIVFSPNYSLAFDHRFDFFEMMAGDQDQIIKESTIEFYADATEFPNTLVIITQLAASTQNYILHIINQTSPYMAKAISEPLLKPMEPPVYGSLKPLYRDFMAPGLILGVSHFLAVGLTALCLVMDRKEGLLERSFVAGVKPYQIIMSHIFIQFIIILIQILLLLFTIFVIFQVELKGSIFLVTGLTLLQGIAGMSFGFLISSLCHEEQSATILSVAVFYPNLVLSGTVWPLEAMPEIMRDMSYTMPQTLAIKSLRYIITRGWDLTHFDVSVGFATTIIWILVFNFLAIVIFAVKK